METLVLFGVFCAVFFFFFHVFRLRVSAKAERVRYFVEGPVPRVPPRSVPSGGAHTVARGLFSRGGYTVE